MLGWVLAFVFQTASVQDRDGTTAVIDKMLYSYRHVTTLFADDGYRGKLIA